MLFPCRYVGMPFWNMHVLIELIIILKAAFFVTSTIYHQRTLLQEPVISGIRAAFLTYFSPHDKCHEARAAIANSKEISRGESHELRVHFQPGDLYIWDNCWILHGGGQVLKEPRTSVGQTMPEQAVVDDWRAMKINRLIEVMEEKWLRHVPQAQVNELIELMESWDV